MGALCRPSFPNQVVNAGWAQQGSVKGFGFKQLHKKTVLQLKSRGAWLRGSAEPSSARSRRQHCCQPTAVYGPELADSRQATSNDHPRNLHSVDTNSRKSGPVGGRKAILCQAREAESVSRILGRSTTYEQHSEGTLSRRKVVLLGCTVGALSLASASIDPAVASEGSFSSLLPASSELQNEQVQLVIGSGCGLGVSIYPDFEYDAKGNGGIGSAQRESDGRIHVKFDPSTLQIPPVNFSSTKFLKLPLPPPLKIAIESKKLEGYIDPETGKVELDFLAEFLFTAGPLYKAKPLIVSTTLTTESSKGPLRSGQGQRLDSEGRCILVGVARVAPVDDPLLDPFLMLPTDCLAKLPAQFVFQQSA